MSPQGPARGPVIIEPSAVRVQLAALLTCAPSEEELEPITELLTVAAKVSSELEESYGSESAVAFEARDGGARREPGHR